MSGLHIVQIPVLTDNYIYLAHDPESGMTAVIDPALTEPVIEALRQEGWGLTHILNTHHHTDHIGANLELKSLTKCIIVGPAADEARIPGIEVMLGDGDSFKLGHATAKIFDVPGHTKGHIAYWFEQDAALFCGDTLFSMGCGRLFEGTPEQMWSSLQKLMALPDETKVYCAHEYTAANGRFAMAVEPDNPALQRRVEEVLSLRAVDRPTVPSTIGVEKKTNPFLRPDSAEIQANIDLSGADAVTVFAETRRRKDLF
jgi:hydroxyacylglutathione hydrolase